MRRVILQRRPSSDEGTPGDLTIIGSTFTCVTGELDWVDADGNGKRDPGMSRVKASSIIFEWAASPSRKNPDGSPEWSYRAKNAPDIEGMLIHAGNFCGRKDKGRVSDVLGCIIIGADWTDIVIPASKLARASEEAALKGWPPVIYTKQKGVSASKPTLSAFVAVMGKEPFELEVRDA